VWVSAPWQSPVPTATSWKQSQAEVGPGSLLRSLWTLRSCTDPCHLWHQVISCDVGMRLLAGRDLLQRDAGSPWDGGAFPESHRELGAGAEPEFRPAGRGFLWLNHPSMLLNEARPFPGPPVRDGRTGKRRRPWRLFVNEMKSLVPLTVKSCCY
jgi:hypothetical protein